MSLVLATIISSQETASVRISPNILVIRYLSGFSNTRIGRVVEFLNSRLSQTSSVDIFEMTAIQVTMNIFNDIITTLIEGYRIRRTNLRDVFGGLI